MTSQALNRVIDSLAAGNISVNEFMRAVEEHVQPLQPVDLNTASEDEHAARDRHQLSLGHRAVARYGR
jgi:hypothetical protein